MRTCKYELGLELECRIEEGFKRGNCPAMGHNKLDKQELCNI